MRIHLPLHASHFSNSAVAGPSKSSPPLVTLGGDLVLVELQGELSWEGDKDDGVIGVIGVDRPDKPTLHLGQHHLLHGKMVNLPKPYAVIRRVVGNPSSRLAEGGTTLQGDAEEEESQSSSSSEDENEGLNDGQSEAKHKDDGEEEEEEEDGPLFAPNPDIFPATPNKGKGKSTTQLSSSPFYPPSTPMDYSSDLEMSSPAPFDMASQDEDGDEENEASHTGSKRFAQDGRGKSSKRVKLDKAREERAKQKVKRKEHREKQRIKRGEKDRTRSYEVVGVVRKKVVFALRPEPLVAPTILPE